MTGRTGLGWNPFRRHALGGNVELLGEPALIRTETKSKTWGTTVSRVPSWPEEARPLKNHTWVTFLYGIGDIILVLLPIYFLCMTLLGYHCNILILQVLGIATATLDRKPTQGNTFGSKVEIAMELV
jgi:hypothetical protein